MWKSLGVLLAAGGVSCYTGAAADGGAVASDDAGESSGGGGDGTLTGGDAGEEPTPDEPDEVPAPTVRRLTRAEFAHSVKDLLGVAPLSQVEADSLQDGFFAVGNARVALSPAGVALYEKALDEATAQAFADPAHVAQIVACVPASVADTACLRDAIAGFGRRAWRRPMTSVELERYLAVAATVGAETGDAVVALRHAIWGLLQSPHFVYRVELGAPSPADGGRVRFSSYEMASRLAFTLWNTVPDEALLDAAEREELTTDAGVRAQATRMLADPRARQGVENFIAELYSLWALDEKAKDDALFPEWTPTLREAMRLELLARIDDVVFTEPGDFFALYDSRKVFVDNELAQIYGLPAVEPDGFRAELLPEESRRRGLIGAAGVLAMNSLPARTSATERGQFIAEALLCRSVPPPPPNVDTNLDDDEGMQPEGPQTLREKLEPHRANPTCAGCHDITDPLGLALEHFDTIGRWRDTDQGLTIDASGELDGVYFADSLELAELVRDNPDAPACLVRKLFLYSAGRGPFLGEGEVLDALEQDLDREGNRFDRLLHALVTHEGFCFANPGGTVLAADEGDMP